MLSLFTRYYIDTDSHIQPEPCDPEINHLEVEAKDRSVGIGLRVHEKRMCVEGLGDSYQITNTKTCLTEDLLGRYLEYKGGER